VWQAQIMNSVKLGNILTHNPFPRTVLLWAAVTATFLLFLAATSSAHAHGSSEITAGDTTQAIAQSQATGHAQDGREELPTCHHGAVTCSPNFSISNEGLAGVLRTTSTVPFSVITGFPPTSSLTIDPPPPKQRTAELN